nr:hypothetical protein CFP56_52405 [Quercus suber]
MTPHSNYLPRRRLPWATYTDMTHSTRPSTVRHTAHDLCVVFSARKRGKHGARDNSIGYRNLDSHSGLRKTVGLLTDRTKVTSGQRFDLIQSLHDSQEVAKRLAFSDFPTLRSTIAGKMCEQPDISPRDVGYAQLTSKERPPLRREFLVYLWSAAYFVGTAHIQHETFELVAAVRYVRASEDLVRLQYTSSEICKTPSSVRVASEGRRERE